MADKILADLELLRNAIGGLKAERKQGVPYAVKSAKDLMLKLRNAMDDLHMHVIPVKKSIAVLPYTTDRNGNTIITAMVTGTYRVTADDGSFVEYEGVGFGAANDDKGAGKAATYAWKNGLIEVLSLPDDDMIDTDDEVIVSVAKPTVTKKAWGKH